SKDAQGLDHTKSIREVSPRNALEMIIRHFTDSAEQKRGHRELTETASEQLRRSEEQSVKARDFSIAVDKILDDHSRAAGVLPSQITPRLNSQQIEEIKEFAEKLPLFSTARRDFTVNRHQELTHQQA